MNDQQWTEVVTVDSVTEEVLELVRGIESGWYNDKKIDWEDVWERLDGSILTDGSKVDLGPEANSPAMRHIQKVIRKERSLG